MKSVKTLIGPNEFGLFTIAVSLLLIFLHSVIFGESPNSGLSFFWIICVLLVTFVPSLFIIFHFSNEHTTKTHINTAQNESTLNSNESENLGKISQLEKKLEEEKNKFQKEKDELIFRHSEEIQKIKKEASNVDKQSNGTDGKEKQILQLQNEKASLEGKTKDLQSQLANIKSASETKVKELESQLKSLQSASETKVKDLESQLSNLRLSSDAKISQLEARIRELEQQVSSKDALREAIQSLSDSSLGSELDSKSTQSLPVDDLSSLLSLNSSSPSDNGTSLLLDLPDDATDFMAKFNKKENNEPITGLDLPDEATDFMAKFNKKEKKKTITGLDLPDEGNDFMAKFNKTENKESTPTALDLPDDATELMARLGKKGKSSSSSSKSSEVLLMDLFKAPGTTPENVPRIPWKNGDALIKNFAVKEDPNKRGMRKSKSKVFRGSTADQMEDRNVALVPFVDSQKAFFAVFDGHAGSDCSSETTIIFPEELKKVVTNLNDKDFSEGWKTVYKTVDQKLIAFEDQGTTSTTALIWQHGEHRYLQVANVGDSTGFLKRGNTAILVSKDHNPDDPEERQRIINAGFELPPGATRLSGLAVSRALGDHFHKKNTPMSGEPFISPLFQLTDEDDALILASDGLWDVMTGQEAVDHIQGLPDADSMAKKLIQTALHNPACQDNITVLVVLL